MASLAWNKAQEEFIETFPDIDEIVATPAAAIHRPMTPGGPDAAGDATAAQEAHVEQLGGAAPPPAVAAPPIEEKGAAARSALEGLKERMGEARVQLGEFAALAETGALRVGSKRAGAVRVEDETLTQLLLKLDAVALPPGDEALRSMRKALIQEVHELGKELAAADDAAAAKAEEPDEVAVTRRAEGEAAHSSGDFEAAIELFTEAMSDELLRGYTRKSDDDDTVEVHTYRSLMGRAASSAGAGRYAVGLAPCSWLLAACSLLKTGANSQVGLADWEKAQAMLDDAAVLTFNIYSKRVQILQLSSSFWVDS